MTRSTVVAGASALICCGPALASPLPTPEPVEPAAPVSTPVAAGVDSDCEHVGFGAQQFIGAWTEPGETTVTTLHDDFALTSSRGGTGAWSFMRWASTPGRDSAPAGEDDHCVLWLHWQNPEPPMDLVYVPLKSTNESLQLSYVGRGNTITWIRPQSPT